ncbi:hypothetical protein [Desulfonema magnum]|uniref:Uncharacterized protein n=1 Tax=Desulfonema magnum TaxID=45655 RepID=A0A975BUM3_9BACT|nr:hypothetical protein [Desulfonema magnum]QTA92056.1 Uncharacterized protein dnm_081300 [Desulfonema magnum]
MKDQTPLASVLAPETLREIDLYLEEFYSQSVKAGNEMARAGLRTTQIRGLETLVTSASRFSEIINYIKNQAGKDKKGKWLKIASLFLEQLEQIEHKSNEMSRGNPEAALEIKMKLARGWAKQVVAHYLYSALQR